MGKSFELKGSNSGITLLLNPDVSIEKLLTDICMRFAENRAFFGDTSMVLTLKGRELSDDECNAIIQAIEYNSDVKISLLDVNEENQNIQRIRDHEHYELKRTYENAKIHIGNVSDGEKITSDTGIVIIGDLEEGGEVTATGNVIVTGTISGFAAAGQPNNSECFIYGGMIKSTLLVIGNQEGELPQKKSIFKGHKKDGGDVLLYRQDHFIITNIQDEMFMNYPKKRKG